MNVCESGSGQGFGCIDPTTYDSNGNGTLEFPSEMSTFCNAKCTGITAADKLFFPWAPEPGNESEWAAASTVAGCVATPSTTIVGMNACQPKEPKAYGSPTELPPTSDYMASTDDAGNAVSLQINGQTLTPKATLAAHFALYDCNSGGIDGGKCSFVFTAFDLQLASVITSGVYRVTDATLSLAQTHETTVEFQSCVRGQCTGTFQLSNENGNPLGVDLRWTQQNTLTGSTDSPGLNLSNAPGSLGGLDKVVGTLVLDETTPTDGDLRLQASGADTLGGSFASIDLDLTGVVTRF